jgi:hypothetical protein
MAYTVTLISGLQPSLHRGIAFLESDTDRNVNAHAGFGKLKKNRKRDMMRRFDHWLAGNFLNNWHHGFPRPHADCYTFKTKDSGSYHRLYGFLIHPRPLEQRFQACVLVSYAIKNQEHTDLTILDRIKNLRTSVEVIGAVRRAFAVMGRA